MVNEFLKKYFFDIVKTQLKAVCEADYDYQPKNGKVCKHEDFFYSWVEIFFEIIGTICLCLLPKTIYILFALIAIWINLPLGISLLCLLVFRLPSNKSPFNTTYTYWYSEIKFNGRSIF